jgi:hypothetical protein
LTVAWDSEEFVLGKLFFVFCVLLYKERYTRELLDPDVHRWLPTRGDILDIQRFGEELYQIPIVLKGSFDLFLLPEFLEKLSRKFLEFFREESVPKI